MAAIAFTRAFAAYGAKLANPQWAVSAIADDGALVISCWTHYIKPENGLLRYRDRLSRWSGNELGNSLLRRHLELAFSEGRPVRYLAAKTGDTVAVDTGHDASKVKKTFSVRPDLVGKIVSYDGDEFVIDFDRAKI